MRINVLAKFETGINPLPNPVTVVLKPLAEVGIPTLCPSWYSNPYFATPSLISSTLGNATTLQMLADTWSDALLTFIDQVSVSLMQLKNKHKRTTVKKVSSQLTADSCTSEVFGFFH